MGKFTFSVTTTLLMRVGSTKSIEKCYKEKTLQFGCAANWLDYALNEQNETIGDVFECVFAQTLKGDPRISAITDSHGKPMGDHLLVLENTADNSCILRYIPTILMPVMCFYSFNVQKIRKQMDTNGEPTTWFAFNLDEYCKDMNYDNSTASYLFITDPVKFYDELTVMVPIAVADNKTNLTSKRFYGNFNPNEPVFFRDIDYHKHKRNELFWDNPENMGELFWKLPEYEQQSELRYAIPNINFIQTFDPNVKPYDYKLNTLDVRLPHFQEYSQVVSASEAHSLYFGNFDDQAHTNDFAILRMTFDEIKKQMGLDGRHPVLY